MSKCLVSIGPGGLSSRINCLISSMRLADKTKKELILYWRKNEACNCNFSDLFDNKIKEISKEEIRKIIKEKDYEWYQNNIKNIRDRKKFIFIDSSIFGGFSSEEIHLRFEKTPIEIQKEILFYLNKLKIKKDILTKVNKFVKKEFLKNTIGVHIRRGDYVNLKNKIGKVSSDEKFIEEIKREIEKDKNVKFFLATEDKPTENKLKTIFKDKIIIYPKKTNKREEEGAVIEALIEILLLSKCNKILGSFGSTFTELAWFLGGCKKEVKIIIDKRYLNGFLENKKHQKGIMSKIKKFTYELFIPESKRLFNILIK